MSARPAVVRVGRIFLGLLVLAAPGQSELWIITNHGQHPRLNDWSPDDEWILFDDDFWAPGGNCDLYVVPPTGTPVTQITLNPADDCGGAEWSRDMQYIAYMSTRGGDPNIWVMPWNGSGSDSQAVQMTFGTFDTSPTWSPDGTEIAFVRNNDIWVMPFPGGENAGLTQLTTYPGFDGRPSWSPSGLASPLPTGPDGSLIAFASERVFPELQIWVVTPTGGDPIQVTTRGGFDPDWHPDPDENMLVYRYSEEDEHENSELGLTEAYPSADTARVRLTYSHAGESSPKWSGAGLSIAFMSDLGDGDPKIYGLDLDCAPLAVSGSQGTPSAAASIQNYPNPFNPSTRFRIRTQVPVLGARLLLFDTGGQVVRNIPLGDRPSSEIDVLWDGRDGRGHELPSGMYFYRFMHAGGMSETGKAIMLR